MESHITITPSVGNSMFVKKYGPNHDTANFDDWQNFIAEETQEGEVFSANVIQHKRWDQADNWEVIFDQIPSQDEIDIMSRCIVRLFNTL